MKRRDIWFVVGVLLVLLGILMFIGVVFGATCDRWVKSPARVNGLPDIGDNPGPVICYNCTGIGYWELIIGRSAGNFWGFYWNGTSWVRNDSLVVAGLPDLEVNTDPAVCYNCTGSGHWELIAGSQYNCFGFYWNGTQWVRNDSLIIPGLSCDWDAYYTPEICYNCTGNGYWELIIGCKAGTLRGYYWNGTQWVRDSSIVAGVGDVGCYANPAVCNNCTGSGHWELFVGQDTGYCGGNNVYGFYWNGTQWVQDDNIVAGLNNNIGRFASPAVCNNCTGSGRWEMIAGELYGAFRGFKYVDTYAGINIIQDAIPNKTYIPAGENNTITAKAQSDCGLKHANISVYDPETGTWVVNDGTFSQVSLTNDDSEQTASFTGKPSETSCDSEIKVKVTFVDYGGVTATTSNGTYYFMPYLHSTSNSSIVSGIASCSSVHNATITPTGSGDVNLTFYMPYFVRNATFKECNYEVTEDADRVKISPSTEYCAVYVTNLEAESGTSFYVKESTGLKAYPPSNLPAAVASAGLVIIFIYTIATRKRS